MDRLDYLGLLRSFAAFLKVKNECVNSRVYNYTGAHLSNIIGCSRQTADRHLKVFLKEEWARYDGNNLVLEKVSYILSQHIQVDPKQFNKKANVHLQIRGLDVKEILLKLKYLIIKQKELNQQYILELVRNLKNTKLVEYKKLRKKVKKYNINDRTLSGVTDERLQISYKGLANLLNCSIGSAYNTIKKMRSAGLIKKYRKMEVLLTGVPSYVWDDIKKTNKYFKCFYANGNVIRNHCNKYNLVA